MVNAGDGDLEIGPVDALAASTPTVRPIGRATVYDEILDVLSTGGWIQGRDARRRQLSLTAAIDRVVGSIDGPGPRAEPLARSARLRNHLCELAGTANLVAWNDERERCFDDLVTLLSMASVAFPDD